MNFNKDKNPKNNKWKNPFKDTGLFSNKQDISDAERKPTPDNSHNTFKEGYKQNNQKFFEKKVFNKSEATTEDQIIFDKNKVKIDTKIIEYGMVLVLIVAVGFGVYTLTPKSSTLNQAQRDIIKTVNDNIYNYREDYESLKYQTATAEARLNCTSKLEEKAKKGQTSQAEVDQCSQVVPEGLEPPREKQEEPAKK
ncbi:MAG: hypothetical protein ACRCXZ_03205 [Patescibacteria group bacterium]